MSAETPDQTNLPDQIRNGFDSVVRVDATEDDKVWKQYMGRKRDWRDLVTLIQQQDIQLEFQHRALQILLAPDISRLPFATNLDAGLGTYVDVSNHWIESITDEQTTFIAGLILDYIKQAHQTIRRDEHNYQAREALCTYNSLIPRLLGKLPPEQAERLFESFSINDPLSYWNMDTASGYKPLLSLYSNKGVDESWKRRAASQMHDVIEREQRGEATPRVEHEAAARSYGEALELILYVNEGLPISRKFYQDEIIFMLGVKTGKPIVASWHTGQVLDLLDDPKLRHSFARRQVLTGEPDSFDRFNVYNDALAETARLIIDEFPDDAELRTYLEQQLQQYAVRAAEQREHQEQAARVEQDVLQRMRKPSSV